MRTHRSTFSVVLFVALTVGALLVWGPSPAAGRGLDLTPRPGPDSVAGYRSVVIGATVVSLASLDLPGPTSVPTVPPLRPRCPPR